MAISISLVTWNIEWRRSDSPAAEVIRARIAAYDPDVICLTEAPADFFGGTGHVIEAEPDYGYGLNGSRRKVLLWSKKPWSDVDQLGSPDLPSGRFVGGTTETPIGLLNFIGVCIPWSGAHVTTGRKDRKRWEDHLMYLEVVHDVLAGTRWRTIVLGDFNQALPRRTAPGLAYEALDRAVLSRFEVATSGLIQPLGKFAIDHVGHTPDLKSTAVEAISAFGPAGEKLSDHFGLAVTLSPVSEGQPS